jgi:Flp pilus assembly protein TadD
MVNWARGGHFADPAKTWQTLGELGLGAFEQAPLPVPANSPLALSARGAMFEPAYLAPWVVVQFPVRLILEPDLVKAFSQPPLGSHLSDATAPGAFAKLEQAGLVCRTDARSYDVHPLATCFIPTPVQGGRNATDQDWTAFRVVAQFAAHLKTIRFGKEGSVFLRGVRDAIDSLWWLPSLIQSWRYMGELTVDHGPYLALGRRIRERLLEAELGDYWNLAFADMHKIFEKYPPDRGSDGHQARLQWISLQILEAKRAGDSAREIALAREAAELSTADTRTQMVDAYDAQMKLGRAERDPARKRMAFERAIQMAGEDTSRVAVAELELTRILRTESTIRDLARARDYGGSALDHFRELQRAELADQSRIVEATLSLSLVYFDLFRAGKDESGVAQRRGEALCRESLQLATVGIHKANAAYNLGLWRLWLGDPGEAEKLLLTALSTYDALGESEHLQNKARYFRLRAIHNLLSKGDNRAIEARVLAVDLLPRLLADPEAPDAWKVDTYRIGESLGATKKPLSAGGADVAAADAAVVSAPGGTEMAQERDVAEKTSPRALTTRELAQREPSGSLPEQKLDNAEFAQLFELAEQVHVNGDLDDARDLLHGLIVLDRQSTSAWALLGRIERDAGLMEDARAAFAFALALEPDNAELTMELARVDQALHAVR